MTETGSKSVTGQASSEDILRSLSEKARGRLEELAQRHRTSARELALTFLEGAIAADELEEHILRQRLAKADAGGPFVRHEDVLAWLKALSEGRQASAPTATIKF